MLYLDIQIRDKRFSRKCPGLKSFCQNVLQNAWLAKEDGEVSLVLADDSFVHELNKRYRDKDKPTNVLSFETGVRGKVGSIWSAGDIIIAYDTVLHESIDQQKTFAAHLAHLLIHGILHLQGYDHQTGVEAKKMESLERKLMKKLGYDNPYKGVYA